MNMVMTDEEKIRVHFNGLTSALEQLRQGPRRNGLFTTSDAADERTRGIGGGLPSITTQTHCTSAYQV